NQIIEWLKVGRKVYVSSSLGADRAGTVAFLVNGLLGVDEESLSKDYELSSFSEDVLEDVIRKRTDSQYVGMVNKIKTLDGETLQKKIYNYFKTGVNGTAVSTEDLDWFIKVMLEKESSVTGVVASEKVARQDNRIYNLFGQEVLNPGKGIYIMNGKKFIVK
ncbi:MAG: tyrosine-protein phosphatase, partial [Bacteroidaceae bacterium]|nr:tyrosine-protein phosphatase [Bacteroidaceae bacterium]